MVLQPGPRRTLVMLSMSVLAAQSTTEMRCTSTHASLGLVNTPATTWTHSKLASAHQKLSLQDSKGKRAAPGARFRTWPAGARICQHCLHLS